ncbi:MAG: hypothetical protein NT062_20900, partial [Proteobacteria bacterium]|nr:hypothetical protein [Pseudomonadota bacterium]
ALAFDELARAAATPLVPASVLAVRALLTPLGGTAKTTGAGGGDVAIAVVSRAIDVTKVHRAIIQSGCTPLELTVDERGVDISPDAA